MSSFLLFLLDERNEFNLHVISCSFDSDGQAVFGSCELKQISIVQSLVESII